MTNTKKDGPVRGAILFTASEIGEDFDFWRISRDFEEVMAAPNDRLILCDNTGDDERDIEELEQKISDRYVCEEGCTKVERSQTQVSVIAEREPEPDHGYHHRRRRRRSYCYQAYNLQGWKVLPHIKVAAPENHDQLQLLSQTHGYLLIDEDEFYHLGGETRFRADGFVTAKQCGHIRIKWNPVNSIRQEHRKQVREIESRLAPELPQGILNLLGECVTPNNWPGSHPWAHEVFGPRGKCSGYDRNEAYNYNANEILRYIQLTRKLWPKDYSWRYRHNLGSVLEAAVQHIHGLRASTDQWNLKLAKWITREARVAKVEIPRKPQLPRKPNKKRKRTCQRNSPQIKSPPPSPTSEMLCAA